MHLLLHFFAQACTAPTSGAKVIGGDCLPKTSASSDTISTVFLIAFAVIGAIAFLFLVIGGTRYVMSQGNPESIQKAKNQIQYSLIGLIIAASAAAVVNFVIDRLQ